MFCKKCGHEIEEGFEYCPNCGEPANLDPIGGNNNTAQVAPKPEEGKASFWWAVLGFFIPLAGLIVFLVEKDTRPKVAKKCGIGAIVGVVVSVLLTIILVIVTFVIAANSIPPEGIPGDPSIGFALRF